MPKLIINATGDQFFVPDPSRLYFDDLPGEKHLRYVPNADHSMRQTDVDESVLAFYRSIVEGALSTMNSSLPVLLTPWGIGGDLGLVLSQGLKVG